MSARLSHVFNASYEDYSISLVMNGCGVPLVSHCTNPFRKLNPVKDALGPVRKEGRAS